MKLAVPGLIVAFLISLALSIFLWVELTDMRNRAEMGEAKIQETMTLHAESLATTSARIAELERTLLETSTLLEESLEDNDDLRDDLRDEKDRNEEFEDQIEKISSTVGTLDKLSKTDKQLLQKYSKVYFLNEHYIPEKLSPIDSEYLYNGNIPKFLHARVMPFFEDLIDEARDDGIDIAVTSAYRSFDEQRDLKGEYQITYGTGANTFSADQGFSEHQLGTTIDITTKTLGGGLRGFESTPAYSWLLENAHNYGFVLSYPENNAYYIYEPWHWRFVGVDLAKDLHEDGKHFYDLDQREIDAYLISIFD